MPSIQSIPSVLVLSQHSDGVTRSPDSIRFLSIVVIPNLRSQQEEKDPGQQINFGHGLRESAQCNINTRDGE